ncbi:putative cupin superfamily protein [Caulobacter ginsengisoli]|uniref:Cupin superfamily protein n=1 Tax=Caulobacter ginsengisoli TaxID=400775 RepID=A0ABU0IMR4_9CAUL|nr:cupin domain-containing protein [Caulobacter ginsengisoli]MDQ0463282.1 putative cupin superfamily protein [Caulobacter ginsengisoli]
MAEQRIVNLADLAMRQVGDGKTFGARVAQAGPLIGSTGLGVSLVVVPPGKSACPFHRHHVWHELFFILEGEGVTRLDGETRPVRPGDLIAAPAGKEAHQIINTGATDLRYLALSADGPTDIVEYPDSGKIAVDAGMAPFDAAEPSLNLFGRLVAAEYYDSEEEG